MTEANNYEVGAKYLLDVGPARRALRAFRDDLKTVAIDQTKIGYAFREVGTDIRVAREGARDFASAISRAARDTERLVTAMRALRAEMHGAGPGSSTGGNAYSAAAGARRDPTQRAPAGMLGYDWDYGARPLDTTPNRRGVRASEPFGPTGAAMVPVGAARGGGEASYRETSESIRADRRAAQADVDSRGRQRRLDAATQRREREDRLRQQWLDSQADIDSRERQRRADVVEERLRTEREQRERRESRRNRILRAGRDAAVAPIRAGAHSLPHVLGVGAVVSGIMGVEQAGRFIGSAFRGSAANENIYTNLRSNRGFGDEQEASLRGIVAAGLKANPTLDLGMATEAVSRLYQNSAGNMAAVRAIAPTALRNEATFLMRHGGDREAAARDSLAIMRGVDLRNTGFGTPEYAQRYSHAMDVAMQLGGADPATISGQAVFQGMLSAGVAADTISDEGLAYAARGLGERASNVGNQLRSFNGLFVGGHVAMSKRAAAFYRSRGLIGHDGQFIDQDTLRTNPIFWIRQHLQEDGHGNALPAREIQMRMDNIQRGPARTLDQNILNNWEAIRSVHDRVMANDPRLAQARYERSAQYAIDKSTAAFSNFSFAVGKFMEGPGIRVLDTLAGGLNHLTAAMQANPDLADQAFKRIAAFFDRIYHIVQVADRVASRIDRFLGGPPTSEGRPVYAHGGVQADTPSGASRTGETNYWMQQITDNQARERRATPNQPDIGRNGQIPARVFNPH